MKHSPWYVFAICCVAASSVNAQWIIQRAPTVAGLRGVAALGNGIAWASGTGGTILQTTDGGDHWRLCATPPGAAKLDFRGVQAFDEKRALVMASGPGDQSRLYKTVDGGASWKLVFTNPDAPAGFFDALQLGTDLVGNVIGDAVAGKFAFFRTTDGGETWTKIAASNSVAAQTGEGLFAASNSSCLKMTRVLFFVTGGSACRLHALGGPASENVDLPLARGESAGAFSMGASTNKVLVVVGGDYKRPDLSAETAATSMDGGRHWSLSEVMPHGFRSAVAYEASSRTWIAVGPNGTDVSSDDGRHWSSLRPQAGEPADADRQWNAIALPYAVGPKGRIGKLRPEALRR